jgi:glucosylceramidase
MFIKLTNTIAQITLFLSLVFMNCWKCTAPTEEPVGPATVYPVQVWTTSPDHVNLLYAKTVNFAAAKDERFSVITIDTVQPLQTIDGFGFTLTGGSAQLINRMGATEKAALLEELFGRTKDNSVGFSYLRISVGASDLDANVFSYNDLPTGQTDPNLDKFSLAQDTVDLIPVLKAILAINPTLKLMGSPWSPPVWMKDNGSSVGGTLKPQYYSVYAKYLVKYVNAMQARGIAIDAMTPQNEPQHGGNNPSMVLSATQEADFVKNHLGPAFQAAGIKTKIVVWDHNCDNAAYPIAILNDPAAKAYVDGSAFHLYNGDISALSQVHDAHPDRNLYFTEQWTGANGTFSEDLKWHLKNVVIGSMRNWSRIALEWNLANDPNYQPHTPGGCSQCKGALTINGSAVTRNVGYYIIAQASKFVPPGSVRLTSNLSGQLANVAFKRPDGKKVLIVLNDGSALASFNISCNGKWIVASLNAGSVATFVWQ